MYLLNKVRKLPEKTSYEVIDFNIKQSNQMIINTLDRQGLDKILTHPDKDFKEENGYLISSAETCNNELFRQEEFKIGIEVSLFTLLQELANKGAFFIPASFFKEGREYKGEEVSNFYNIRVSSSSMYVGFSLIRDNKWVSSKILYVEDGFLRVKSFYIALPQEHCLECCKIETVSQAKVNGKLCNVMEYCDQLPVIPDFSPVTYLPLPLFNYLNLHYSRCVNTLNFISDMFTEKGIESSSRDYIPLAYSKAITVESSIRSSSKKRRDELRFYRKHFSGELEEFNRAYKLNTLEYYTFTLLEKVRGTGGTEDNIYRLLRHLRIRRSEYSLVLMQLRCQLFKEPFIFPEHQVKVIARGGGGGDTFHTLIGRNNY